MLRADGASYSFWNPGSNCVGPPGAEGMMRPNCKLKAETKFITVTYEEALDFNLDSLFAGGTTTGGGIDPANLPEAKVNDKCQPIYPHQALRVNTVGEIVVAAGKKTAYADKHPAYDVVRGPSNTGLTTGYFPEINSIINAAGDDFTINVATCKTYDQLHVNAFLDWLDGKVPEHSEDSLGGDIPTLFGGNFQSVSVGQKTKGYVAGSVAGSLDFSPDLKDAVQFVDDSLGAVIEKMKDKKIYDDSLIIVCSKHGQSPIDPTLFKEVDPDVFTKEIGVPTDFITFDDIALVFLTHHSDLNTAVANLKNHMSDLRIGEIIFGQEQIDLGFGDPTKDGSVPDIIVQPVHGTIYTTSKKKIAEHGGGTDDDRHVACFAHNPKLKAKTFPDEMLTTQVAPTILKALGLKPQALKGVQEEDTKPFPPFGDNK